MVAVAQPRAACIRSAINERIHCGLLRQTHVMDLCDKCTRLKQSYRSKGTHCVDEQAEAREVFTQNTSMVAPGSYARQMDRCPFRRRLSSM